jgi:NTE family protein
VKSPYARAMDSPVRAALALGSGGARGYAHIGVIQVLEERGVEVVSIAGSSMGALVGGLFAAGKLDAYTEWVANLSQFDVLRLLDVSLTAPGVIRADKIFARVRAMLDGARIEDLPVPFTAVATDLLARRAVWFQQGPVDAAVRASSAMPGVFTPVMLNGRVLVDGGLMDPVPVGPTASVRADITIAVDLGGERSEAAEGAPARETAEERPVEEWADRFRRGAANLLDRDVVRAVLHRFGGASDTGDDDESSADGAAVESLPADLSRFDVMYQSLEAMQSVLTRYRLAGDPPDVLVTVPKDACRSLDFHRASEMIAIGRELTIAALDRAAISPPEA